MIIRVKAFPESKKEEIKKIKDNKYEVYTKAKPWRGEANVRILELLTSYFKDARGVRMISGGTRPNKTFEVIEPTNHLL